MEELTVKSITGVDIALPIAGPGGRSLAFVIDWHIRVLLALGWVLASVLLVPGIGKIVGPGSIKSATFWLMAGPPLIIYFLYHPLLEWATGGQTPGKRAGGIRIVMRSGEHPTLTAILVRNVFRLVDSLPAFYAAGLVATVLTRDQVRIGDLAAGTVLVYEPGLGTKDTRRLDQLARPSRVPTELREVSQDLLERWPQLDATVRRELAMQILMRLDLPVLPSDDASLQARLRAVLEQP